MKTAISLICAALIAATPASAKVFVFGGSSADSLTKSFTVDGETLQVAGLSYAGSSAAVDETTLFTPAPIHQTETGIGVCQSGESGDQCRQVDTSGVNEALLFAQSGALFTLNSATLSIVDFNDSLKILGVTGGTFTDLGIAGLIVDGLTGPASVTRIGGNTYTINFAGLGAYEGFLFFQHNDSDDGYRINSLTTTAVPEPAAWAMMVGGFGLIGGAVRRSRRQTADAALA